MFKHSLLTLALAGLITGLVKSEERKIRAMAEKVEKLRDVEYRFNRFNEFCFSCFGACAATCAISATLGIFLCPSDITTIQGLVKIAGISGVIAAYTAIALNHGNQKVLALDEIKEELKNQA